MPELSEEDNIECHLQQIGMGTLICRAASQKGDHSTNEVTPEICFECDAGKIFRKIGCDSVLPKISFIGYSGGSMTNLENLFCKIRKRNTSIEYCEKCTLKVAHTTKTLATNMRDIFEKEEFYTAFSELEKAKAAMRDGKNELVITYSITLLESTMRIIHEKRNESLPEKLALSDLYKSLRSVLKLNEIDSESAVGTLSNSMNGIVLGIGHIRNSMSDSHGKGSEPDKVSGYTAEFVLNTCSSLATFFIRRLKDLEAQNG